VAKVNIFPIFEEKAFTATWRMTTDLSGDGCGDLVEDNIIVDDDGARAEGLYLHPVEGGGQRGVLVQRRQLRGVQTLKTQARVASSELADELLDGQVGSAPACFGSVPRVQIQTSLSYEELKH
jgi:hypothetical protein